MTDVQDARRKLAAAADDGIDAGAIVTAEVDVTRTSRRKHEVAIAIFLGDRGTIDRKDPGSVV